MKIKVPVSFACRRGHTTFWRHIPACDRRLGAHPRQHQQQRRHHQQWRRRWPAAHAATIPAAQPRGFRNGNSTPGPAAVTDRRRVQVQLAGLPVACRSQRQRRHHARRQRSTPRRQPCSAGWQHERRRQAGVGAAGQFYGAAGDRGADGAAGIAAGVSGRSGALPAASLVYAGRLCTDIHHGDRGTARTHSLLPRP